MNELEDYLGVKLISACLMNLGDYNNFKGWKIPENEDPTKLGYLVKYDSEYYSWSPKEVFEKAYRPTTGLNFGLALEALKLGKKVTRPGWNGKNMYLYLQEGSTINQVRNNHLDSIIAEKGSVTINAHIDMKCADGTISVGWRPTNLDMFADDWQIIY